MLEIVTPSIVFGDRDIHAGGDHCERDEFGLHQLVREHRTNYASIKFALRDFEARDGESVLLSLRQLVQELEQNDAPFASVDAPANILFTSGTTGNSRGVTLSHRNLISNALAKLDAMPEFATDVRLNFLPFAHAYARTCELTTWLVTGSTLHTARNIEHCMHVVESVSPTLINGVPHFYQHLHSRWKAVDGTTESLRRLLGTRIRRLASGGAALPPAIRNDFDLAGLPIFQGYGLTETSPVVCSNRDETATQPQVLHEVGSPVVGNELRIDSDNQLWVRGDCVMLGYWNDPEATGKKIVDGWLRTGDLAEWIPSKPNIGSDKTHEIMSGATVRILGRSDDAIVLSTGDKVHPASIETLLMEQFAFDRCLLIGTDRPYLVLVAQMSSQVSERMVLSPANAIEEMNRVLGDLSKFERPRKVLFVDDAWTAENGLLNFKGAMVRKRIEERYRDSIDKLYRGSF